MFGVLAGLAISAYSTYSQHKAGKSAAANANSRANYMQKLSDAQLAEQQAKQAKWDRMFGPMEKNLAEYYSQLSSSNIIAKGNEALAKSYEVGKNNVIEQLRSRGLEIEDGVGAAALTQLAKGQADARAELYSTADDKVAQLQQQALSNNRAPSGGLQQNISNMMGVENMRAGADALKSRGQQQLLGNIGDLIGDAGAAYGDYKSYSQRSQSVQDISISNPSLYSKIMQDQQNYTMF